MAPRDEVASSRTHKLMDTGWVVVIGMTALFAGWVLVGMVTSIVLVVGLTRLKEQEKIASDEP